MKEMLDENCATQIDSRSGAGHSHRNSIRSISSSNDPPPKVVDSALLQRNMKKRFSERFKKSLGQMDMLEGTKRLDLSVA